MSANQENLFALADVKGMSAIALMKVMKSLVAAMKMVTTELEIKSKKPVKEKAVKEDKVKGPTPPHLMKNNAWVAYAKTYARENGWEAFNIHQKEGDVEVAASVLRDGVHVHEASGKGMAPKEAMSYAKHLWSAKTGTGAHKEIFEAFEAQYGKQAAASSVEAEASAEEPEEEPVVASASASAAATPVKAKKQVAQTAPLKAKASKAKAAKVEWEAPVAGNVKAWGHEGETYLRDNENRVWHAIQGGELGAWKGIYNEAKDEIEEAEEPLYEDE
jgi:hypothetical protein